MVKHSSSAVYGNRKSEVKQSRPVNDNADIEFFGSSDIGYDNSLQRSHGVSSNKRGAPSTSYSMLAQA